MEPARGSETPSSSRRSRRFTALGADGPWCALGSVKSQIGHTKAAAGSAGIIKAALALHHKVLPPTSKIERPIERLQDGRSPFYLNTVARPWLPKPSHPRRAAVSAFGFGGSNFHCVLEEAEPEKALVDWDGDVQILAYSSDQPDGLVEQLNLIEPSADWSDIRAEGSRSRLAFEHERSWRVLLVARRGQTNLGAEKRRARAAGRLRALRDQPAVACPSPKRRRATGRASSAARRCLPVSWRFCSPARGRNTSACCASWLAAFLECTKRSRSQTNQAEAGDSPISSRVYPRPSLPTKSDSPWSMPCAKPATRSRRSGRSAWVCS